jgi:hypothetical protein
VTILADPNAPPSIQLIHLIAARAVSDELQAERPAAQQLGNVPPRVIESNATSAQLKQKPNGQNRPNGWPPSPCEPALE